jgi:formate-dependent nitrite reductase membrane component NrfD
VTSLAMLRTIAQLAANPQSGVALPPRWGWYIVLYFFIGGLAAGTYFIASMLDLAGDPRDRETVRLGYGFAFPAVVVCGLLLILDLGKPLRFWHMLIKSERVPLPIFKPWSPISFGTWALSGFAVFAFISFVGTLLESGRLRWPPLVRLDATARRAPRPLAVLWGILGILFAFSLGGYTGVLVTGSSVPFWHNARLMGALFLCSAISTSYALLMLVLVRRGRSQHAAPVEKLARADRWAIGLELLVLAAMLALLGGVARPMIGGGFGVLFWLGVVALGLLTPLVLHWRGGAALTRDHALTSATCVLVGGLLLRFVVVMSPQWPRVSLWHL